MRVQKNQLSMQVMREKAKVSRDGSVPIAIRLTVSDRTKTFYLGRFSKESQLVKDNSTEAKAINKAKLRLLEWPALPWSLGYVGQQTTVEYLKCFTFNDDIHESK